MGQDSRVHWKRTKKRIKNGNTKFDEVKK